MLINASESHKGELLPISDMKCVAIYFSILLVQLLFTTRWAVLTVYIA